MKKPTEKELINLFLYYSEFVDGTTEWLMNQEQFIKAVKRLYEENTNQNSIC